MRWLRKSEAHVDELGRLVFLTSTKDLYVISDVADPAQDVLMVRFLILRIRESFPA